MHFEAGINQLVESARVKRGSFGLSTKVIKILWRDLRLSLSTIPQLSKCVAGLPTV